MIEQVAAAFDRKDYKTAIQLLKQLQKQSPDNPWVKFYIGRAQEVSGKLESAEAAYRKLLQETTNPKVAIQAREGLQRLENIAKERRQQAISQATADPANAGIGFLILEPVPSEARQTAAQAFARIMKLDPYTARLQLPSRGWRLYRTGAMAELQIYGQNLRSADIPVFWAALAAIQTIRVFQVHHFQSVSPQVTIICQDETNQLGSLTFDWSEVKSRVEGMLPIFEDVVDLGVFNKLKRKEQTQDYVHVLDLHLPKRNCILRVCDRTYQFHQGVIFNARQDGQTPPNQITTRIQWNQWLGFLHHQLPSVPIWSDFMPFAETALDHLDLIKDLEAHIDLLRKAPTNWDAAFQLYSGLVFEYARTGRS
ncbi:MAG: tetratricopeptide repeat protein [Cyanobacteria bacterium CRU_2_1]|nr:tetratricopeptide repeat protein [Cyanobacteria bacterium RU_5_0]NJR57533.1 tetratricopeptide repeat protein [Cyanobacteria bacterium CRU_2_1]